MTYAINQRLVDIQRFYLLLDQLEEHLGGCRTLANCSGKMDWPKRGIYFFFEPGEFRTSSGAGLRVVRVGTHALKTGSKTTIWKRLSQHQGTMGGSLPGGGNHRGSVFRKHVGSALIDKGAWSTSISKNWGANNTASREVRETEYDLELTVSKTIREMPFLWLEINDPPEPNSQRGYIERNAIALLSNARNKDSVIDPPREGWLGLHAKALAIQESGLWNVNHVYERYDQNFLLILEKSINK